jgi:hypothetical protein
MFQESARCEKVSRRRFMGATAAAFSAVVGGGLGGSETPSGSRADVVIYGGTPAGLAAAAAARHEGASVIVAEPTGQIGGMITGGIAVTDTPTPELVGGLAGVFFGTAGALQSAGNIACVWRGKRKAPV